MMIQIHELYRLLYKLLIAWPLLTTVNANEFNNNKPDPAEFLPGSSYVITNILSASRDTGYTGYSFNPQMTQKGGAEFALTELKNSLGHMRFSFIGFIEIESNNKDAPAFFSARHNVTLWRGHYGYGISQTIGDWSRKMADSRGIFELYLGWRHESEHYTGDEESEPDLESQPLYWQIPNIGDWLHIEETLRTSYGNIKNDIRLIQKYYIPVEFNHAYNYGLAMDFILEYKPNNPIHPYSSTYIEYIDGNKWETAGITAGIPNAKYFYQHFGISFKGTHLRVKLYTMFSSGNGKGKLIFEKSRQWGWGINVGMN